MSPLHRIRTLLGAEAAELISLSYAGDWLVACAFWFLSGIITRSPPFQRDFSVNDLSISHPHTVQQISGFTNNLISLLVPFALFGVAAGITRSVAEAHHAMLGLWTARGLTRLITEALKNRVGRLRPDFLSRCKWDEILTACTGKASDILDGRKSFPSGHSSTIFAGMGFLSFWLAGKTSAWCFDVPIPSRSLLASRLGRLVITLAPLSFASWVAISRVEDYRHHKEDVIAGSLIGLFSATVCYLVYWPSPFSRQNYINEIAARPRMLYSNSNSSGAGNNGYELTRLEGDMESV